MNQTVKAVIRRVVVVLAALSLAGGAFVPVVIPGQLVMAEGGPSPCPRC
jgi:hypothetical protein